MWLPQLLRVSSGFNENRGWWVLRLGHAREPCRVQYNSQDFAEAARNSSFKNCCSFCTLTPIILSNNYVSRSTFFYFLQRHQILIQLVTTNLFQIISNVIQSLVSCFCLWVSLVILFSVSMWQYYHVCLNFNLLLCELLQTNGHALNIALVIISQTGLKCKELQNWSKWACKYL